MSPQTAIYARMSKDANLDGLGVERQLADCRAEAEKRGWPVVVEYIDNDVSATRKAPRPQYELLMAAVRSGRVQAVVCWDVDRLSRTPRELEDIIDLADSGLQLASCGGYIDLGTPQGRMTARIKGTVGRHEVEQLKRRMARSLAQRATSGKAHGRAPYGWAVDSDGKRRNGRPDVLVPEQAAVIRETAGRLLTGESVRSIVADLNARGVPATRGGKWVGQTLRTIMMRDRNCGRRVHLGEVMAEPGDWPPILDAATHDRVVALLSDPARNLSGGAPRRHLLSMLATCGVCGAPLVVNPGRPASKATEGKRAKAPGYACTACFGVRRAQTPVDELVTEVVIRRLEKPDAVDLLARPGREQEVTRQREIAAGLAARLDRAADEYADEKITAQQLTRITAKLRPQIEAARLAVQDAMPRADLAGMAGPGAREAWMAAPLDVRRLLIDTLMTVAIMPSGPGRRKFDPSLIRITPR